MSKVYLLTRGEYSDYTVLAAYSTRELAEQECVRWQEQDGRSSSPIVEEYDLDVVPDVLAYSVEMRPNGNRAGVWRVDPALPGDSCGYDLVCHCPSRWGKPERLLITVLSKTPEQAIKAANEKRVQWIAAGGLDKARREAKEQA